MPCCYAWTRSKQICVASSIGMSRRAFAIAAIAFYQSLDETIAFLRGQCTSMRKAINLHIKANETLRATIERLRSIPAIGEKTANRMTTVFGANAFSSAK